MRSLYAQYVKERENLEMIENEHGFLTYRLENDRLFISDIFVTKDKRKSNIAAEMIDRMYQHALEMGIKEAYAHADLNTLNWKDSVDFMEKCGGKPTKLEGTLLYFRRTIG